MISLLLHIRCLLLLFVLVQTVSLYRIYASDTNDPDISSSFNEKRNLAMQHLNTADDDKDTFEDFDANEKRSISSNGMKNVPQRRNNRPHWNPLVAAYKRCAELSRDERESCFKDAVQMLFVHKLKK